MATRTRKAKASDEREPDYGTHPTYTATSQPCTPVHGRFLGSAGDVYTDCRDMEQADREHFLVYFLTVRHHVIGERYTLAIGSLTGVEVHPRELFREAIRRGSASMIVVHNHPSGDATPSRQDLELTTRIRQGGDLLGISVLDHVIVGQGGFVSLASRGWC